MIWLGAFGVVLFAIGANGLYRPGVLGALATTALHFGGACALVAVAHWLGFPPEGP